jgi:hypothetical protein
LALSPQIFYGPLAANRASGGFAFMGSLFDQFAWGLSNAMSSWAINQPQNLALMGIATGTLGAGTIAVPASKIIIPPTIPIMTGALAGAGFNGQLMPSLATVVTLGISQAFNSAGQYSGIVGGVGIGVDSSKIIVSNAGTLVPLLLANLSGMMGGSGAVLPSMCAGLGNGIASLLMQGAGIGTVVGTPSIPPLPGTGVSNSVVI